MAEPDIDYGKIEGTVTINGETAAARQLVAVSLAPQDTGEVDGNGDPILANQVVGAGVSAEDGTYTLALPGFFDETIVVALDTYGERWKPNRTYTAGDKIRPTLGNETGYVYECTIGGISDPTEPTWWIDDGSNASGSVGTATFDAIPAWAPVAHAPVIPTYVSVTVTLYPLELDPYFDKVFSLCHYDGLGGATTIDDVGGLSWAAFGNAQLSTLQDKFGGTSLVLDGAGDYLTQGAATDWKFLHDATIEYSLDVWVRPAAVNTYQVIAGTDGASTTKHGFNLAINASGQLDLMIAKGTSGTPSARITGGTSLTVDTWHHIAVVFYSGAFYVYLDGALEGSATPVSPSQSTPSATLQIGRYSPGSTLYFSGNIDDFRITKAARYTEPFSSPTEPFPDSRFAPGREPTILDPYFSSVTALLHFEGLSETEITGGSTWATFGSPTLVAGASVFGDTGLLLDGSQRITSTDLPVPAGDFTAEAWVTASAVKTSGSIIFDTREGANGTNLLVYVKPNNNFVSLNYSGASVDGSINVKDGGHHHIAITRAGNVFTVWVNGVADVTTTSATALAWGAGGFHVGASNYSGASYGFNGGIDEFRFTDGVSRYTSAFTPPASAFPNFEYDPFENLATTAVYPVVIDQYFNDTVVALHFDDEPPTDLFGSTVAVATGGPVRSGPGLTDIETMFGNCYRFGGGGAFKIASLASGGRVLPTDVSESYTFEAWVFQNANTGARQVANQYTLGDAGRHTFSITNGVPGTFHGQATLSSTATIPLNTWAHVAWVYDAQLKTMTIFVDGVASGSADFSAVTSISDAEFRIGAVYTTSWNEFFDGYIDDLRVTRAARYTADFTPPTAAFPDSRFEPGKEPTILDAYFNDTLAIYEFDEAVGEQPVDATGLCLINLAGGAIVDTALARYGNALNMNGGTAVIPHSRLPDFSGTNEFTVEIDFYISTWTAANRIFDYAGADGLAYPGATVSLLGANQLNIEIGSGTVSATGYVGWALSPSLVIDQWYSLAWSRKAGNDYIFLDGALIGTRAAPAIGVNARDMGIGCESSGASRKLAGAVDRLRITSAGRYDAAYSVPASDFPVFEYDPFEDLSKRTEVDPYFDDVVALVRPAGTAGSAFTDNITTSWTHVGSPVIRNIENKLFAGLDSILYGVKTQRSVTTGIPALGANFTIEFALLSSTTMHNDYRVIFDSRSTGIAGNINSEIKINTNQWTVTIGGTQYTATGVNMNDGAWHQYSITRVGPTVYMHMDGALVHSFTNTTVQQVSPFGWALGGIGFNFAPNYGCLADIAQFRITNAARYGADGYTPPTEPHPDSRYTYAE